MTSWFLEGLGDFDQSPYGWQCRPGLITRNTFLFAIDLFGELSWNWLYWRTRLQPIRTTGQITARIKIFPVHQPYLYQKLSKKATQLRLLEMSYEEIAKSLDIGKSTVARTYKYKGR